MPRLEATLRPKRALRCSTPTLGAVPQTRTPAPPPTRPRAADLKLGAGGGVHQIRAEGGLSDSSESAQHACERSFVHAAAVVCTKDPDAPVGGRVRMGECGQFSYGYFCNVVRRTIRRSRGESGARTCPCTARRLRSALRRERPSSPRSHTAQLRAKRAERRHRGPRTPASALPWSQQRRCASVRGGLWGLAEEEFLAWRSPRAARYCVSLDRYARGAARVARSLLCLRTRFF